MLGVARLSAFQRSLCTYQQLWTLALRAASRAPMSSPGVPSYMCLICPTKCVERPLGHCCHGGSVDESLQLVRRCGLLRHRADGICALLDEHCPKLLLDSAFPRWPRSLEHRSLRQNHLAFVLYACCCRRQQVVAFLWCEVALRRNRASLLWMRVRPVQASSAAASAQQSRFRALRHWLPPCCHVHGGAGYYVGCRTAFGVPAQPLHLSAIVDSRLACCQPRRRVLQVFQVICV